jgi:predicted house-cleaning noncanonical NTP pyrophosphatase (MazG superfamily)
LSNSNLIGIKSKLDKDDIIVIINIFQAICDKNYYIFDYDFITFIIYDEKLENETYLINSIQSYNNVNDWIEVLKYLPDTFNISEEKLLPCRKNLLRNIKTNKLVNKNFKKIKQKYYLINEIFYNKEYF